MSDTRTRITQLWQALDAQDFERARALLHPDVVWTDLFNRGQRRGRDDVQSYWNHIAEVIWPESTVLAFEDRNDGRLAVRVHHVLRDSRGKIWTDETVVHVYAFEGDLIIAMDAN